MASETQIFSTNLPLVTTVDSFLVNALVGTALRTGRIETATLVALLNLYKTDFYAATRAALYLKTDLPNGSTGYVLNDPTVAYNGQYIWNTSPAGWTKQRDLVDATAALTAVDALKADLGLTAPDPNYPFVLWANTTGGVPVSTLRQRKGGKFDLHLSRKALSLAFKEANDIVAASGFPGTYDGAEFVDERTVQFGGIPNGEGRKYVYRSVGGGAPFQVTNGAVQLCIRYGDSRGAGASQPLRSGWVSTVDYNVLYTTEYDNFTRVSNGTTPTIVRYSGADYVNINATGNTGKTPSTNPTYWRQVATSFYDDIRAAGLGGRALTTPQAPYRVFQIDQPQSPGLTNNTSLAAQWKGPAALIPARSGYGIDKANWALVQSEGQDTLIPTLLRLDYEDGIRNREPKTRIAFLAGEPGYRMSELMPGATASRLGQTLVAYQRMLDGVTAVKNYVTSYMQRTLEVPFVQLSIGENDLNNASNPAGESNLSAASAETTLLSLCSSIKTDVQTITGQASPPLIFIENPVTNQADYMVLSHVVTKVVRENASLGIYGMGPTYDVPYFSPRHWAVEGGVDIGDRQGVYISQVLEGYAPRLMMMSNARFTDSGRTVVRINLNPAVGNVVIDTDTVPLVTIGGVSTYGFRSGNGMPAIRAVSFIGNTAEITLASAAPTTGYVVSYAYYSIGAGNAGTNPNYGGTNGYAGTYGNIRDETATVSRFQPGVRLRNWMMPEELTVTTISA